MAISDGQREVLETLVRSHSAAHRLVQRAQVLLLAGDGVSNSEISEVVGVSRPTVLVWRSDFEKDGLVGFGEVAKGRGRKPSISDEKVAEIVDLTLHSKPAGETHWSCRSMATRVGVSPASVQRIWSARGLKPHLVKTFKLSNDRRFKEKLVDVVGLYLNPPDQAVVLCMDEKSQFRALDRTQPSLPMKKGRAGTMRLIQGRLLAIPVGVASRATDHISGEWSSDTRSPKDGPPRVPYYRLQQRRDHRVVRACSCDRYQFWR